MCLQSREFGFWLQPSSVPAWPSLTARWSTVALPALQSNFRATVADVQWVVESYGLLLAALILVGGSLGDLFGRRLIFLLGVGLFALASAGCGIALSIDQLILARSVQGVGAALLVPGSLAIISASFDEKSRGQAIGTWSGFTAITTALGPVLGGWLIEHASWRWVFFINVPLAAAVIVISLWHVAESRGPAWANIDWRGALAATLGLGGLVNGFIESESEGVAASSGLAQPRLLVVFFFVCSFGSRHESDHRWCHSPYSDPPVSGERTFSHCSSMARSGSSFSCSR